LLSSSCNSSHLSKYLVTRNAQKDSANEFTAYVISLQQEQLQPKAWDSQTGHKTHKQLSHGYALCHCLQMQSIWVMKPLLVGKGKPIGLMMLAGQQQQQVAR
jgi:hypothetical protein